MTGIEMLAIFIGIFIGNIVGAIIAWGLLYRRDRW
jgi:gas vesicle protein